MFTYNAIFVQFVCEVSTILDQYLCNKDKIRGRPMYMGIKKALIEKSAFGFDNFVVPPGIEPGTHGFSVRCSTN